MDINRKFKPLNKVYSYFLRKALFFNRDKFHNQGLPSYAGLLSEYISIDIMVDGVYDIKSMEEIVQLLQSDFTNFNFNTLIDVGANIGNHSVFLSKYFVNVIAFEPNPFTFEILKINVTDIGNIEVHNCGLSSTNSSLYLSEDSRNLGGSKVYYNKEDIPSNLKVRNIHLKKFDSIPTLNISGDVLIKIDIEGHELEALKGAETFIKKKLPIICFEQHENDFVNSQSPSINFLSDHGYEFYLFESKYQKYKFSIIRLVFKLFFGDKYSLIKISDFKPNFYDSIIAIHKSNINLP